MIIKPHFYSRISKYHLFQPQIQFSTTIVVLADISIPPKKSLLLPAK